MALLSLHRKSDFVWWQFWVWPRPDMMAMLSLHRKSDFVWWQCLSIWWHCSVYTENPTLSDGNYQEKETSDGNAQFWQKQTYDSNVQSDGNDQFWQKETSDGNAQFQPTCPLVSWPTVGSDPAGQSLSVTWWQCSFSADVSYSKSADCRIGSGRPKSVSHLMAMLSFRRQVLQ